MTRKQPTYPDCPCCGHDKSSVVPDGLGFFHCMLCGGDFDNEGEIVPYHGLFHDEDDIDKDIDDKYLNEDQILRWYYSEKGPGTGELT